MIRNLTPHAINIVDSEGRNIKTIEPSGLARVAAVTVAIGEVDGIPLTRTEFGEVEGLPEPEDGTVFIVSALVKQRVPNRHDVVIPNELVRNEKGVIIGCKSLSD